MKQKDLKSFLRVAMLIVFAAVSLLIVCALWNIIPRAKVIAFSTAVSSGSVILRILFGLLLIGFDALLMWLVVNGDKTKNRAAEEKQMNLLCSGEMGASFVSGSAINEIVQRCVRSNPRVKSCESRVIEAEGGGVIINLNIIVLHDTKLPEFCAAMQNEVKRSVESVTGIAVRTVAITIVGTAQGNNVGTRVN